MQFYFGLNDNRFCPKENILVLLEQRFVLVKMDYPPKGNFLYPFPSPEKEGKTEKEKGFQKEKIKKKGTKNRKHFLPFFQLLLSFFSPKKKKRGKR